MIEKTMLGRAEALATELIRLRRDMHRHPELGFQEFRTAALVAETLAEIGGMQIRSGVGRTGVVAEMGPGGGPTIAIRADMDALPIDERNEVPYCSEVAGVMHACGHDAHTAILLTAAHLLHHSLAEEAWRGKVRLLFQPSEEAFDEQGISGATAMLADGALEGVDAVIALHVWSTHEAGTVHFQDGYSLAAVDAFDAWIRATGGHGAYPHQGTDPFFMLGPVLNALYAIPSRQINPLQAAVVSIGEISGGHIHNVIPHEVHLKGTLRSFDESVRQRLRAEVERAFSLSQVLGGSFELRITPGYPALHNDPRVNDWLRHAARDLAGERAVLESAFGMGSEDFAYMAREVPGAMFMLGAALPGEQKRSHHTDIFDIDESVLPLGAAILAETARRYVTGRLA